MVLLSWAVSWYIRREEVRELEAERRAVAEKAASAATVSQEPAEAKVAAR
jgi:hypothetical protein